MTRLAPIPPGAKTLKLEVRDLLTQAGFITRSPGVARAPICVPGRDPSRLVPIAYRLGGQRVGCQTVWAEPGKPMRIFFDSSSGDEDYWVYLVDKAKQPARLDWVPQAELVEEVRSLDRYDPKLETLDGFLKLWEGSTAIMGRGVPLVRSGGGKSGPAQSRPARVICRGFMPFRSKGSDRLNVGQAQASRPAWFSRLSGTFHIAGTDRYRFVSKLGPAGYVLLDGQLVAPFQGDRGARLFDIELEKGPHRVEVLQYARAGQNGSAGLWWRDPRRKDLNGDYEIGWWEFGCEIGESPGLMMWEPMADATSGPLDRSRAQASWASFSWYQHASLAAVYPGHDLNWYRFSAHAPGGSTNAVYRWRFDDGRTAEGKQVTKLFLRSGMRKVQLEVLDAPRGKVIARAAGEINVQINLAYTTDFSIKHDRRRDNSLLAMIWAFAEEDIAQLPLADLVNLYEWSYPLNHWGASWKLHDGTGVADFAPVSLADRQVQDLAGKRVREALALRIDEVIAAYPYSQLLQIAQSLSRKANSPTDASYAAAEKLLAVVMDRSPAGSSHWRASALGLADIKLLIRGKPELAVALLKKLEQTEPAVDMLESWQFAGARENHPLLAREKLAGLTQGLDWSPISWLFRREHNWGLSFIYHFDKGRGFWVAKTFDLPAGWKGKQLIFKDGVIHASSENVWINGEPLGRMWQWPDGNIVIPERYLKKGGENRITWLIQPASRQEWGRVASSPGVSADLSRIAYSSVQEQDHPPSRIQIRDVKRKRSSDLGSQTLLGGALQDIDRSLAFSHDGRQLASGHQYGKVRLWDVDAMLEAHGAPKATHTIRVAPASVVSLAFSPDGKRLATGSEDARITLLDPVSGKRIRSSIGHASTVLALAFSPDGKRLASASHDGIVKIWDASSGKELLTLGVHAGPVHAVVYSPDGKRVASAIDESHIRLWDATTGAALRTLDSQPGEVLSLAFSPDGRRLAAGSREGFVNQWDLASGKKLTMVHHRREGNPDNAARDAMVTKVLYSLDGKQLISLGIGVGRQWDSETGVGGGELTTFGEYARPRQAILRRPESGPDQMADGFENYPVELYTSEACDAHGMNYASYAGKWDKLPDFDKLTPVKQGVLNHIDPEHLKGVMLPYWKITKKDGRNDKTAQPSGVRMTGYLRVKKAGDYAFSLQSRDGSRLVVGSKIVIDNDGLKEADAAKEVKHGSLHLEPGVHSFVLTYFSAQDPGSLNITFPDEFVRSLTMADMDRSRLMAGALLALGRREEAKALLVRLHRGGWPLSDREQYYVEQTRIRIRRLARASSNDRSHALKLIDSSLTIHPMLRLDPEFMVSVIAVYANIGDPRAAILAEQMLEADMNEGQRRLLIMTQVKVKLNEGDLPAAGKVYQKLKKLAPQSEETIEARELIRAAVVKRRGGK